MIFGKKNFFVVIFMNVLADIECIYINQNSKIIVMKSDSNIPCIIEYINPKYGYARQNGSSKNMREINNTYMLY